MQQQIDISRRAWLTQAGTGFGALAFVHLLSRGRAVASPQSPSAAPVGRSAGHAPRARSVIFLFMEGGPSHLDLFDPKPDLQRLAGRPLPPSFKRVITAMGEMESPVLPSRRVWNRHGESGLWISDWLPHISQCADDLTVVRSCWTNAINHSGGVCQMNTGVPLAGRPSLGSWAIYGLGTENENLPAFVVLQDNKDAVINGPRNWSAGFMPAIYQGTLLHGDGPPIANLHDASETGPARQRRKLDLLTNLNRRHLAIHPQDADLEARINSYELAFRMQATAPEAIDLGQETDETQRLYGLDTPQTRVFGRNCLLARRLVERGVRFVQLYHGSGSKWDAHQHIEQNHTRLCLQMDRPVAGLLQDLKRRGLLESTLVIWGGEFGRTPMSEKGDGRDHNPTGFTMWLAGAGLPGGRVIGATDDVGFHAVEEPVHVHDLHATILHLLGLDHEQLIYFHKGRPERIDSNEGKVIDPLLG